MKKSIVTLIMASFAGVAFAGPPAPAPVKNPVLTPPPPPSCFNPGEWTFDTSVAGLFVDGGNELAGGGVGLTYFPTLNVGLGADYSVFSDGIHIYNANLVLRAPIESACLALYGIGGVGGISNGDSSLTWSAGIGVEWRCSKKSNIALFADARYLWVDDYADFGDEDEAILARAGIRVNF